MRLIVASFCMLLAGCGEVTWILLEIESTLQVTEEVDELEGWVREPEGGAQISTFEIPLSESDSFPMTILLEPSSDNPNPLLIQLEALKADQTVASVAFEVQWKAGADNFPEPITLQ